jgi:hypothetical protein
MPTMDAKTLKANTLALLADSNLADKTKSGYVNTFVKIINEANGTRNTDANKAFDTPRIYKQFVDIAKTRGTPHSRYTVIKNLYSLAKVLGKDEAYKWLSENSKDITTERDGFANDQTKVTRKQQEDYVPYEELVARTKDLVTEFVTLAKKVEKENETLFDTDIKMHDHALIAWLNTAEPNIRSALANTKIIRERPSEDELTHGKENLLYVPKTGACTVYINTDKVSATQGPDHWDWRSDTSDLIRLSLKVYPRYYLFNVLMVNKPMTSDGYNKMIKAAFATETRKPSQQTIRHATVDHFYATICSPPLELQKDLARRMRHSVEVQNAVYRKVAAKKWPSRVELFPFSVVPGLTTRRMWAPEARHEVP